MSDTTRPRTRAKIPGPRFSAISFSPASNAAVTAAFSVAILTLGVTACGSDSAGSSDDAVQSSTGPDASNTGTNGAMTGAPVANPVEPAGDNMTPVDPNVPTPIAVPPTPPTTPPTMTTGSQGLGGDGNPPLGEAGGPPVSGNVGGMGDGSGGSSNPGGAGGSGGASDSGGSGGAVSDGGANAGGAGGQSNADSGMSSGCGTEPGIPSNSYNNGEPISIMAANMERRYILRVPEDYDNTKPYKLIVAWHQLDGNDVQMYANDYYHLSPLSGGNAIFVAPNGQKNGSPCTTTNNGDGGCGWPNSNGSDVALGDAVVNEIKENFCIDTNRIFATGWSYGGSMSYKHACERGLGGTKDGVEGYIRGIAVYSGAQLSGQCSPSTPVAYYGSHGTNDGVLGYDGGVGLAENFAEANGCSWSTPARATGDHVCTEISGCPTEYPTTFCSFNGDHTPDPRDGNQSSWQYQLVWDFFDQF